MTRTIRRLASSERGFVGAAPTTCAFEVTLRGDLDLAALTDAFTALRAAHPALDAVVTTDREGAAFATPGPGARLTVDRVDRLTAPSVPPLVDPAGALGRLHVATDGRRHRVTLAANHALADGSHLFALVAELWSQYTELVRRGIALPVTPEAFPASAQDVLAGVHSGPDTGRDRLDGIRWYGAAPVRTAPDDGAAILPEVASLQFSEQVTAGFAAVAAGIGVNALLSGVLLCAERAGFLGESPEEPVRIGAMTLVDLRRRIRPPLGATDVTNFVGASFTAADLTAASDPVAVGAAVAAAVREDVAAGRCLNVLAGPAPAEPAEPPVVLSNLGPLALDLPGDLTGEALRPIVSMDSAALHRPAGPRAPSPSATIFQVSTFAGRLGIEAITLGGTASPAARAAVADRVAGLVHATARLAPAA